VAKIEVVLQDEDGPLFGRQAIEGAPEHLAIDHDVLGIVFARPITDELDGVRLAAPVPCLAIADVDQDAIRPAVEAVRVRELRQVPPDQDDRLLGRILGQMEVAKDPVGDREETRIDRVGDLGERRLISPLRLLDQPSLHDLPSRAEQLNVPLLTSVLRRPGWFGILPRMPSVGASATDNASTFVLVSDPSRGNSGSASCRPLAWRWRGTMGMHVRPAHSWTRRRSPSRFAVITGLGLILSLLGPVAPVAAAEASITSAGPLTSVTISDELNCAVEHTGDSAGEFFGDTACATEIAIGGSIYGPSSIPAGNSPGGYTPVSQSAVTGTGTNVDPYRIVTVVDVATTGLRITETDSYVVGQEAYRTDVQVANTGSQSASAILYRGGDCFLQNSDEGFGSIGNPAGAVACVAPADPNDPGAGPGTRIEQWIPLTSGSHYYEAFYGDVWSAMDAMTNFPDTCDCATYQDNGAGLSWSLSIPAGGSQTVSHLTNFSPTGNLALTTTKTADQSSATAGGQDGYTITVSNPNESIVQLGSITDTLPAGFTYTAGSSTGATTADPTVAGQVLTWAGPFPVAAGGTLTLHFGVTVSTASGTYTNDVSVDAGAAGIADSGPTAPITVGGVAPPSTPISTPTLGEGMLALLALLLVATGVFAGRRVRG